MFSKFLKKKVQDIDRTHNSIVEAHFLADHVVPNFFSSEQLCESGLTLNFAQNRKNRPKSAKIAHIFQNSTKIAKKWLFSTKFLIFFFCDTTSYGLTTGAGIFHFAPLIKKLVFRSKKALTR